MMMVNSIPVYVFQCWWICVTIKCVNIYVSSALYLSSTTSYNQCYMFFLNPLSPFSLFPSTLHILGWRRMKREKKNIRHTHTTYTHARSFPRMYTYVLNYTRIEANGYHVSIFERITHGLKGWKLTTKQQEKKVMENRITFYENVFFFFVLGCLRYYSRFRIAQTAMH